MQSCHSSSTSDYKIKELTIYSTNDIKNAQHSFIKLYSKMTNDCTELFSFVIFESLLSYLTFLSKTNNFIMRKSYVNKYHDTNFEIRYNLVFKHGIYGRGKMHWVL